MNTPREKLLALQEKHDDLLSAVREARKGPEFSFVQIPESLSVQAVSLVESLRCLGTVLHSDESRSAAISMMSYWINALYRANWYQERSKEPPSPELETFSPESASSLTEDAYPWSAASMEEDPRDVQDLWARLSARAAERLQARPIVGLLGAAGAGRSFLIRHGLLPCLKERGMLEGVKVHFVRPGEIITTAPLGVISRIASDSVFLKAFRPLAPLALKDEAMLMADPGALARALDESGSRHLIVVEDFHHIFSLSIDPLASVASRGQSAFIAVLQAVAASSKGHKVIVDLQTEFLGRLPQFRDFYTLLEEGADGKSGGGGNGWIVVGLESVELRRFILGPSDRVGLHWEPGLVDALLQEHQGDPAALTLLLFTLRRLWSDLMIYQAMERRNMITWNSFARTGSGRLAFELAAEQSLSAVCEGEPEKKSRVLDAARLMFLELVQVVPGFAIWLGRPLLSELRKKLSEHGHQESLLNEITAAFRSAHLLTMETSTSGEVTLRVCHEAMISRWTRLVQWLEESRQNKRLFWLLRADARSWNLLRVRPPQLNGAKFPAIYRDKVARFLKRQSYIWRGAKLEEALKLQGVTPQEQYFLKIGRLAQMASRAVWWPLPLLLLFLIVFYAFKQHQANATQSMDHGVELLASGDPASASLWMFQAAHFNQHGAVRWLWSFSKKPASEKDLGLRLALGQLPYLQAFKEVQAGLVAAEISPTGKYAALGRRRQNDKNGGALLWEFKNAKTPPEAVDCTTELSIDKVVFASGKIDTLVAFGGAGASRHDGVILVKDISDIGRSKEAPMEIKFESPVTDFAFDPRPTPERYVLAVAFGDATGTEPRGGVKLITFTKTGTAWEKKEEPLELFFDDKAPKIQSRSQDPASRLVFSENGTLAVGFVHLNTSGKVAIFEPEGEKWVAKPPLLSEQPVRDLAFSQLAGGILAVSSGRADGKAGDLVLYKKESGAWSIKGAPFDLRDGIIKVAFRPNDSKFFTASAGGVVTIWRLDNNGTVTRVRELEEGGWIVAAAWSPDGRWIATGNRDRNVRLHDPDTGLPVLPPLYHGATISGLAFTPDSLGMFATTVQTARLWSTYPRERSILPVRATESGMRALLSTDGQRFVVDSLISNSMGDGTPEHELTVWANKDSSPKRRWRGLSPLTALAINHDGTNLAALSESAQTSSSGENQSLRIWDVVTDKETSFEVPRGANFLQFVPGTKCLLIAGTLPPPAAGTPSVKSSEIGFARIISCVDPTQSKQIALPFRVTCIASHPGKELLALGGDEGLLSGHGMVALYSLKDLKSKMEAPLALHEEPVSSLAFSPDGKLLISGGVDDQVVLSRVDSEGHPGLDRIRPLTPSKHTADVNSVGFSADGHYAVTTGCDLMAMLWKVEDTGLQLLASFRHQSVVTHQALSADGHLLATGSGDGVRLWCIDESDPIRRWKLMARLPFQHTITGLTFCKEKGVSELRVFGLARAYSSSERLRAVEAHSWNLHEFENGEDAPKIEKAELLAGQKMETGLHLVDIAPHDLEAMWTSHGDRLKSASISNAEMYEAYTSAAAGQWKAAVSHIRQVRALQNKETGDDNFSSLRLAADIFSASRSSKDMLETADKLLPLLVDSGADADEVSELLVRRGEARLQLAATPMSGVSVSDLEKAVADFQALAKKSPKVADYPAKEAEARVLQGDYSKALECLQLSKQLSLQHPRLASGFTMASQDQRSGVIHLLLAADLRGHNLYDQAAAERSLWTKSVLDLFGKVANAEIPEKGRAAWLAVLGDELDDQVLQQALGFAKESFLADRESYAKANTYAAALFRAGKIEDAIKQLEVSVKRYELSGNPSHLSTSQLGRPVDWIIESLILQKRSMEADVSEERRTKDFERAKDLLELTKKEIEMPSHPLEWRVTWNNLDARVLIAEAERNLKDQEEALRQKNIR